MDGEVRKFLATCVLAALTLLVAAFFGNNLTVSVPLLLLIGLLMLRVDWNARNVVYYLFVFISGPLAESIAIYFGAWTYTRPAFIGIPL